MAKKKAATKKDDKKKCPITRKFFEDNADDQALKVAGQEVIAEPREFSTGSFGWFYNGKLTVDVGGKKVKVQANCSFTVVGSKEVD